MASTSASGDLDDLDVALLLAVAGGRDGLEVRGQVEQRLLVAEAGAVEHGAEQYASSPARTPTSSSSSRRAVVSGGSPSTSRVPAGISSSSRSTAPRYWRTRRTVSCSVTGTTATAPGMADDVAGETRPVGGLELGPHERDPPPLEADLVAEVTEPLVQEAAPTSVSMVMRRGRRPSARRRAAPEELAEQRVGTVGPALELGVGLGPHPEGMAGELDELDEHAVGRRPRAAQPGLLEPGR